MKIKKCSKCKIDKPIDQFFARKTAKDGKMSSCKSCKNLSINNWREKNRDKWNEYTRNRYHKTKPEKPILSESEILAIKTRQALKRKEKQREINKRHEKSDKCKAYRKAYKSREDVKARRNELLKSEKIKKKRRERENKRYKENIKYRLHKVISVQISDALNKSGNTWIKHVDYTVSELKSILERQFLPGMTWENYGRTGWHIDHITPVSAFDFKEIGDAEFRACWSLGNLRPMWSKENISKSDKIIYLL